LFKEKLEFLVLESSPLRELSRVMLVPKLIAKSGYTPIPPLEFVLEEELIPCICLN